MSTRIVEGADGQIVNNAHGTSSPITLDAGQQRWQALELITRHIGGRSRMPLLITGQPGTSRFYYIREAIAATGEGHTAERVRRRLTQDVIVLDGGDRLGDIRSGLEEYRTREQPTELPHKHIIIRALDKAANNVNDLLLKLTEEPPTNTIITITARNRDGVMPAIVSRCLHIDFPAHDEGTLRQVMMTRADLKAALPTLSRHFPPTSTNEARYRFRYNLDNTAEAVSRGEMTPTSLRTEVLSIYQTNKAQCAEILLLLIRLTELHLARKLRGNKVHNQSLLDLHAITEAHCVVYLERGSSFGINMPNSPLLVLQSLLCIGILAK